MGLNLEQKKTLVAEISAKVSDINTNITNMEARTGDDHQAQRRRGSGTGWPIRSATVCHGMSVKSRPSST